MSLAPELAFRRLQTFWKLANPNPFMISHADLSHDLLWQDWLNRQFGTDWTDVVDLLDEFLLLSASDAVEFEQFVGYERGRGFRKDAWSQDRTPAERRDEMMTAQLPSDVRTFADLARAIELSRRMAAI